MKLFKCIGKVKLALIWTLVLTVFLVLFIFSEECKDGALDGILMCLGVLVPSLFPFFVLASFISESHIIDLVAPVFNPVSRLLLGMKGVCITPVIMSVIGGYPVGAKMTATLYKNKSITKNEAQRLAVICCCAGPGFLITFVGLTLLCSKEAGIILLLSQIISIALLCLLSRLIYGKTENNQTECKTRSPLLSEAFVSSVSSAVRSAAGMCGFVLIFSIICNILTDGFMISSTLGKCFVALLEITNGVTYLSGEISLEILCALTGFGGICVHLQIFRELKDVPFSKAKFYLFRLVQGAICYLTSKLLLLAFPVTDAVFSTTAEPPQLSFYSGVIGSIALMVTSIVFIISVRNKRAL